MWKSIALLPWMAALAGCAPQSLFGFRLPDGDGAAGQQAFIALQGNACHEVAGAPVQSLDAVAHVTLGGKTTRVRTYGELGTSIINPSHKVAPPHRLTNASEGESLMTYAYLNDVMTVQQLVDLVAFLQPTYEVVQPPPVKWAMYQ